MRKRTRYEITNNTILVDRFGLCEITSAGRSTAERIAREAGAVVKVGNRKLFVVSKIRDYMDSLAASGCEE